MPTAEELALAEAAEAESPHDAYDERSAAKDAEEPEDEMFQEAEYEEEDVEPQHRLKKPKLSQGHPNICSYICILDEIERFQRRLFRSTQKAGHFVRFGPRNIPKK